MNTPQKAIRSPSYPAMPLRKAVEAVGKIEKTYRSSPVDRADAAKLIGYSALSGPANKALAALAAYGLLDRAGKGEARVTERARDILHAESDKQRKARLLEAAMEPSLYREIRERFTGIAVPPEDGVVTYLNRQGFNPNAVRPAAKAFLETMSYLEEIGANDSHGITPPGDGDFGDNDIAPENAMHQHHHETPPKPPGQLPPSKPGQLQEVFNLDEGPVTLSFPNNMSAASYEDLESYLNLFLRKAKRQMEQRRAEARESGDPDELP